MRLRVRSKLILSISIPLIVTYVAVLSWDYLQQREQATALTQDLVLERASLTAGVLDARLLQAQQLAGQMAESLSQRQDPLDGRSRLWLATVLSQYEWSAAAVVAMEDPAGRSSMVVRPAPAFWSGGIPSSLDYNSLAAPWYWRVKQGRSGQWFSPAEAAGVLDEPTIVYSVPIVSDGTFRGVVAVHLEPRALWYVHPPRISSAIPTVFGQYLDHYLVVTPPGEVIFHSPEDIDAPSDLGEPAMRPVREQLRDALATAVAGQSQVVAVRNVATPVFDMEQGHNYWIAAVPIRGGRMILLSTFPEADAMQAINRNLIRRAIMLFGGMCFMLAIVLFASRRISRPLEDLEIAARKLGQGNLDVAVPQPRGRDEVADLSRVFNTMLEQLRQQVQRIREESEARARVEGELELAREIQTSLLPREVPAVCSQGAFEIQASNLAASQVAGDFYDYFADAQGRLLLVIADVAGHGVPAALLMAVTRTLIRSLATGGLSPAEITLRTNQALMDNGTLGMFVTLVLCMYDPATGELTYTNAGHPAPLVVHADGSDATRCGSTAPLLGAYAFTQEQCEQRTIQMRPGDTLVLYTDGIPEARPTVDAEEFGQERFRAVLSASADRPLRALCDNVVAAVRQYQQGPPSDDLTLLLLRRR